MACILNQVEMAFKDIDLEINSHYDSKLNNIATEFFNPILHESIEYRRIAGLFSSSSFALCARGLQEIIANEGKIFIIASPILTKNDIQALKDVLDGEKIIENVLELELQNIKTQFEEDHISALKFLIKYGYLEIRIHIPKDENGVPYDAEQIKNKNLLSEKLGIFQDRDGDEISFRGPIDESKESWEGGIFKITVDKKWVYGQEYHVDDDRKHFDDLWNHENTIPLPKGIKHILETSAPSIDEIKKLDKYNIPPWAKLNNRTLWPHQIRAINAWINNRYNGIFTIATAGGKTLSALVAANLSNSGCLILIIAYGKTLVSQWVDEIKQYEGISKNYRILQCDSEHPWKHIITGALVPYMSEIVDINNNFRQYIVATPQTAINIIFQNAFKNINPKKIIVIGDEIHHLGAPEFRKIFNIQSEKKIGLSATFERQWDEIGTDLLIDYFGRELEEAKYGICQGIEDKRLCKYRYIPFFAYLNNAESDDFVEKTQLIKPLGARIQQLREQNRHDINLENQYKTLLNLRSDIIKKAKDKIRIYKKIIENQPKKPYVVFMDDTEQIEQIKIAHKEKIIELNTQLNMNENPAINIFDGNTKNDQRQIIIQDSLKKQTPIFAMYCLDEGIDIPELQSAILISSSTSNRQYIQRRGRVLRSNNKDKIAHIYDIVVFPRPRDDEEFNNLIKDAIINEEKRIEELASCAENRWDVLGRFSDEKQRLGFDSIGL